MATLDFRLQYLQAKAQPGAERVHVLLQFKRELSALEQIGFSPTAVIGDIAAGSIAPQQLAQLVAHPDVLIVEASRALKDELDVSLVAINLAYPITRQRTVPGRGRGAIIGIIDSGFDLTHPCFCDARGQSRIIAAWDQVNVGDGAGTPPAGFDYGVEYRREAINAHLTDAAPLLITNSAPLNADDTSVGLHGTQVAGIAAGNGAPDGVFTGVAPEAELIFVAYRGDVPIGGSAFMVDAIKYIIEQARACGQPVVINLSQGDNLGAHDGTSLLEQAIDLYIEREGVLMVNSAGNGQGGRHHARGLVQAGQQTSVAFNLRPRADRPVDGDMFDLWYNRLDRFALALQPPTGALSKFVAPDTHEVLTFGADNKAYVYSATKVPGNGDNRISIILEKGADWPAGRWSFVLRGEQVVFGNFDVWVDRPQGVSVVTFLQPPEAQPADAQADDACTVTLPGTARHIISVGGFIARPRNGMLEGDHAPLSSLGPTRDGRIKPDITAPGFDVTTTVPHEAGASGHDNYRRASGTSMAAPHVTGVLALLLALRPELTVGQIKAALLATARSDSFTGATPNATWGRGKLDAEAAYKALSRLTVTEGQR